MSTNTQRDGITGSTHLTVVIVGQREQGDGASRCAAVAHGWHVSVAHDGHRAQGLARVRVGLASKFAAQSKVLFDLLGLVEVVLGVLQMTLNLQKEEKKLLF